MKNYFRFLLLLLLLSFSCGCGQKPIPQDPVLPDTRPMVEYERPSADTPNQKDPLTVLPAEDDLPPKEGMMRSPLTNEWVDAAVASTRPIAVMIPNEVDAIPQYALSDASVLYEANTEGRTTRLMALFEDWNHLDKIGNIRSARTYYIYWSFEWDAFLVHFGGPYYINQLVEQEFTENIDGLGSDSNIFYRSNDRVAPHNVYINGLNLKRQIRQDGYSLSYRGLTDPYHFQFASKSEPNSLLQYGDKAQNAAYIDMSSCYPLTRCYFEYNEADGLYYRFQHLSGSVDEPHTDASGTQLTFKNILVQYTKQEVLDSKGYLVFQCHDDSRDGWYFTNGKGIHVNWVKNSDYGATRYYDDNGQEVMLNTGKTMICVVNETDSFMFR